MAPANLLTSIFIGTGSPAFDGRKPAGVTGVPPERTPARRRPLLSRTDRALTMGLSRRAVAEPLPRRWPIARRAGGPGAMTKSGRLGKDRGRSPRPPMPTSPLVLIPARLSATRLPNKPLAEIAGEPMVVHTWRRAMEAGI